MNAAPPELRVDRRVRWQRSGTTALLIGGLVVVMSGHGGGGRPPETSGRSSLRVMTWNIHHGAGTDGRVDLNRIAALIHRAQVDLVALQEVDRGVARTDRRDLPGELAALTGMTALFSNNLHYQGGEYGNAILSRLPVLSWTNRHYQMLREGEQRGVLEARVAWQGGVVRFASTHLDYRPDDIERIAHAEEIRSMVDAAGADPILVAGDMNAVPGSRTLVVLQGFLEDVWAAVGEGSGATYPSPAPVRRIDYVLRSPNLGLRPQSAQVLTSDASDHLPVVVQFSGRTAGDSE